MSRAPGWIGLCLLALISAQIRAAEISSRSALVGQDLQFDHQAPYSSESELRRRLGFGLVFPKYDLAAEKFRVAVPAGGTNISLGLLVWISPGNDAYVPAEWGPILEKQRLILVSAYQSGNNRAPIDRCRLALDAVCNASARYRIDPKRVLVAGFSGGARIASVLGVCYGDLFTGTLCVCGADFYRAVPSGGGGFYPPTYQPQPGVLARAQRLGRFALLTGEKDLNRDNTRATAERGFKASGFRNVQYFEVVGMAHALPSAKDFGSALDYLLAGK